MSIGGGVHRAIERSCSIDCTAMQMFVKNNMQWFARPLERAEIKAFIRHAQRKQIEAAFAHSSYLINLAATNPQFHANSLRALAEELTRAHQLELPFLVLHPGAHLGAGEQAGIEKIVASIDAIWAVIPKVKTKIALETTAGQGSCLGDKFEHLAAIIENVREPERLCVCLDTAHVFEAGYDIGSEAGVKKTFREFERVIGLNRLAAIHLNDSKTEDRSVNRRDLGGDSQGENKDRARDDGGAGLVSGRQVRASCRHHRKRARTGTALRLSRHGARFRGRVRHRERSRGKKNVSRVQSGDRIKPACCDSLERFQDRARLARRSP